MQREVLRTAWASDWCEETVVGGLAAGLKGEAQRWTVLLEPGFTSGLPNRRGGIVRSNVVEKTGTLKKLFL